MKYSILLFSGIKDILNCNMLEIDLESSSTTPDIIKQHLIQLYPEAADIISLSYLARNLAYARPDTIVFPTDEIALIPPVSGG